MTTEDRKTYPSLAGALSRFWQTWRHRRAALAELENCRSEVATIAQDLGLTPADLRVLAAKRPDAAALQLDGDELAVATGPARRDLQRLCTMCGDKRRCASDLAEHPLSEDWQDYCPNADTLTSLVAEAEDRRALTRIERRQARGRRAVAQAR